MLETLASPFKTQVLDNCQLEWNPNSGTLYVHSKDHFGQTVLRIQGLPTGAHYKEDLDELTGMFDIRVEDKNVVGLPPHTRPPTRALPRKKPTTV